jgi:hypothetical protein
MNTRMIHRISLIAVFVLPFTLAGITVAGAQALYRMGPSGGLGGAPFYDTNVPGNSKVVEVRVRHGSWIDAVQVIHDRGELSLHGGSGGRLSRITLAPGEHIRAIGGRYGRFVDSIRIYTNRRSSPIYGGSGGSVDFYYEAPAGFEIVGFLGRSGTYLDSIGVIMRKIRQ